jgi:hypothetical protein
MKKLIEQWEKLAEKYEKQARDNDHNALIQERLFVMAEIYRYCADCLRRLKK